RVLFRSALRGLLDRKIHRLGARKDPAGMDARLMPPIDDAAAVAHETAGRGEFAKLIDRGHGVTNGERGELFTPAREEQIAADHKRAGSELNHACKDRVEIAFCARMQDMKMQPEGLGGGLNGS